MTVQRLTTTSPRSWASTVLWYVFWLGNTRVGKYLLPRVPPPPRVGPQEWKLPSKDLLGDCEASYWNRHDWNNVVISPTSREIKRTLIYFHGGGWYFPIDAVHWKTTAIFARELDAEVIVVPVPLAPANTIFTVLPVLLDVYDDCIRRASGREFILAGDSSGSGIALTLAYAAHRQGLPLPNQLLFSSPLLDASVTSPAAPELQPYDPMIHIQPVRLVAQAWLTGSSATELHVSTEDLKHPLISPIYDDVSILASAGTKLIIVSGTWDILYPDIELFIQQAEKAGVNTTFIVSPQQIHDFLIFGSSEGREALDLVVAAVSD